MNHVDRDDLSDDRAQQPPRANGTATKEILWAYSKRKKPTETPAANDKVYYSTPFGNTKDGKQKLFLLGRDGAQYFPVFRSAESMKAFCEQMKTWEL